MKSAISMVRIKIGASIPLKVTHCVTWKCNLSCAYCARHCNEPELNTKSVLRMIDIFSDGGALYWSFNGGEPLMREDIAELAGHARKKGMHLVLNTNGTLLDRREDVLKYIDLVNVSVDGPRMLHDQTRSQSYDKMISGLEVVARRGVRLTFTTVLSAVNATDLDSVLDLAESFGARVFFQPVRIQKEDIHSKSSSFFTDAETMRRAIDALIAQKKLRRPIASSTDYLQDIARHWPDQMTTTRCAAGRAYCFVTPTGHVTACCDTLRRADNTSKSNVLHSGLAAFRNIPHYKCETCFPAIPLETNILFQRSLLKTCTNSADIVRHFISSEKPFRPPSS